MRKIIIAMLIGILAGTVYAASVQVISLAATETSGTWVNTLLPKRDVELKSAFIQYSSVPSLAVTNQVKVSKSGTTYTVDSTSIDTSNSVAIASIDFNNPVWCAYGETTTVTRTATVTGSVMKVMLVVE